MDNQGREKNKVSGKGTVQRRGEGLGTGKVGNSNAGKVIGTVMKTAHKGGGGQVSPRTVRSVSRMGGGLPFILVVLVLVGSLLFGLMRGCGEKPEPTPVDPTPVDPTRDPYWGFFNPQSTTSSGWTMSSNVKKLNTNVASGARAKRTQIVGNGNDDITIMVFMCGTDLESKNAMGTYDLQEMLKATISDQINLVVFTGGCKNWRNNIVSKSVNQVYQVTTGDMECLVPNAGNAAMTNPETLTSFIQYCEENFPANRYDLIFWDHGGGSISGYGYDEKYPNSGSMDLAGIDKALTAAGVSFDFIGFDACLMATTETALMLSEHADYMIGSEESEPGIGWYYTNWLTKLSQNTSMPTLEIGKQIADDFVSTCASQCRGQSATLSVIDLAEFEKTVPSKLAAFSQSANTLITGNGYRTISSARSGSREFGASGGIDMVDFIDMANRVGTKEAKELVNALLSAVKYNNTSSDMSNSYGLSIYFPYRSTKYLNPALKTYNAIDMDKDYTACIKNFATYSTSGQISSGGNSNPYSSLLGSYSQDYQTVSSGDLINTLLNTFLSGGLSGGGSSQQQQQSNPYESYYQIFNMLFGGRSIDTRSISDYIAANHFDADLNWKNGKIKLTKDQWSLVDNLQLNVFYDDGEGYVDLGTDNLFKIDQDGNLVGEAVTDWMSINGQIIPYYYVSYNGQENGDYVTTGRVPCLLNGEKANLILAQIKEGSSLEWVVAGASYSYEDVDPESAITAKNLTELTVGDTIDFVCDYYAYDGTYLDSYLLGDQMTVTGEWTIGNMDIDGQYVLATYQFTDIYQQNYWSAPLGH